MGILKVLNFNKNIQIGDVSQIFFSTLYTNNQHSKWTVRNNYGLEVLLLRRLRDYLKKIVLRQFNKTTLITKIYSWDRHQIMSAIKLDWNVVFARG